MGLVPWAKESIEKLADMGIISGKGEKNFAPNDQITRAEVVKILVGAFALTEENDTVFTDVAADSWYAPYIRKAVAANLTLGDGNGSFRPGRGYQQTGYCRNDLQIHRRCTDGRAAVWRHGFHCTICKRSSRDALQYGYHFRKRRWKF